MKNKSIIIGSDHAGFQLKNKIKSYLEELEFSVTDIGCYTEESVDYPVIAKELVQKIINNEFERGILICGTGIGMSICANRFKNIRAVVCSDTTSAKYSRLHNNSNVLCFGARIVGESLAKDICNIWINTEFEGNRHQKRLNLID